MSNNKQHEEHLNNEEGRTIVHVRIAAPRAKFFNDGQTLKNGGSKDTNINSSIIWNEDKERALYREIMKFQKNTEEKEGKDSRKIDAEEKKREIDYVRLLNMFNEQIPDSSAKIDMRFLKQQIFYLLFEMMKDQMEQYNTNMQAAKEVADKNTEAGTKNTVVDGFQADDDDFEFDFKKMFKKGNFNEEEGGERAWDFDKVRESLLMAANGAKAAEPSTDANKDTKAVPSDDLSVYEEEYDGYDMVNVEQQNRGVRKYLLSTRILNTKLPDLDDDDDDDF